MSKRMYEDLKEILCHELNEITRKGDIDREGLDDVYKLSSAITMVESLMKKGQQGQEGEYSERGYSQDNNRMMPMHWSYEGGGSNDYSRNGMSNERGVTDGRDNSRNYGTSNRMYSREDMSNDYSQRRGRGTQTGRYVSRDDMPNRGSYESYDSYSIFFRSAYTICLTFTCKSDSSCARALSSYRARIAAPTPPIDSQTREEA